MQSKRIELPARLDQLDAALEFIKQFLIGGGFDEKSVLQTCIAAEEIFVNICLYAYGPEGGKVWICVFEQAGGGQAAVRFKDRGRPFNPLGEPKPDVLLPAEERREGGLGILMMQKLVSSVRYKYSGVMNILTITKLKQTEDELNGSKTE